MDSAFGSSFESIEKFWSILATPMFELGQQKISIVSILVAFLLVGVFLYLSRLAERLIGNLLRDTHLDNGVKASIGRVLRYLVVVIGVLITLDSVGIKISSLATFGAVLMVGVGFGLQNIAQNFISGLILLFERPIKHGDIVSVGGVRGRVKEISARSTVIETRDDIAIIVPNSQFISEQVINDSFSGNTIREHVRVGVAYGSDVREVESLLLGVADGHSAVRKSPQPVVVFEDFGDSALMFDLRIWIMDIWGSDQILSDLRFEVDRVFRERGVQIPFPQRDLHIKSSFSAELAKFSDRSV